MGIKENLFQYILGATALFVASIAGVFSVLGIGMLFSGAAVSAMIMATSLECGKVVATSYLYRYWSRTSKFLKAYLIMAILTLVMVTSLGVFGWLSGAYQTSASHYENNQKQVAVMVEQRKLVETQVVTTKQRIDSLASIRDSQEKRMSDTLSNSALSRNPTQLRQLQDQNMILIKQTTDEMASENKRSTQLYDKISQIDQQITDLTTKSSETKDITTFKFVADAIGWDLGKTVKWFIVIIIVVFDPLSVCLILAYNVVAFGEKKEITFNEKELIDSMKDAANHAKDTRELLVEKKIVTDIKEAVNIVNSHVSELKIETQSSGSSAPIEPIKAIESSVIQPPVPGQLQPYEYFSSPTR